MPVWFEKAVKATELLRQSSLTQIWAQRNIFTKLRMLLLMLLNVKFNRGHKTFWISVFISTFCNSHFLWFESVSVCPSLLFFLLSFTSLCLFHSSQLANNCLTCFIDNIQSLSSAFNYFVIVHFSLFRSLISSIISIREYSLTQ